MGLFMDRGGKGEGVGGIYFHPQYSCTPKGPLEKILHSVTIFNPAVGLSICILRPETAKVPSDRRLQGSMCDREPIFAARRYHGCLWM